MKLKYHQDIFHI